MSAGEAVRETIVRRLEGLRTRRPELIIESIDAARYTKFDDWPPYTRQGREALDTETRALQVLSRYEYAIQDMDIQVLDSTAIATFHLHYRGQIRRRGFDERSRVSMILHREEAGWRIVHEHFSRFADQVQPRELPEREVVPSAAEAGDHLEQAILDVLADGRERDVVDISTEVNKRLTTYADVLAVKKACERLVTAARLERVSEGEYLARYRLRKTQPARS